MSKYRETVNANTPHLVVSFELVGENELFRWGMVGNLPILILVGYIIRVQAELAFRQPEECDDKALVIAWDPEAKKFSWFVHPDIPIDSLVGMLEMVKVTLLSSFMASQQKPKSSLFGPDGQPFHRR